MTKRTVGLLLVVIGVIVLVVSLAADSIGIGSYPGINSTQLIGAVAGAILAIIGAWFRLSKVSPQK